jgi:hypothetical protein
LKRLVSGPTRGSKWGGDGGVGGAVEGGKYRQT